MFRAYLTVLLMLACSVFGSAQTQTQTQPPPQTARQALIEMFTGKSPDAFEKHLPEVARHALIHKGDSVQTSFIRQFAAASLQLSAPGRQLQTFEAGPLLMSIEDQGAQNRFEVTVERDDLMGEEDEIEVSLQVYEKGEPEPLPILPRLIFAMKQEKDIWRVNEATLAVHAPLADPEYLSTLKKMQNVDNEQMVQSRISDVVRVEAAYAARYPERGYSCKLSDLYSKESQADAAPQQPESFDPSLADEESNGFHLAINGCNVVPATKFKITAVPIDPDSEMKAFCADNSGKIRFANDGTAASCLSAGEIVKQGIVE